MLSATVDALPQISVSRTLAMPVKWKSSSRFKPSILLKKIDGFRTLDSDGRASFPGFELEECLPILHSMLTFPSVAQEVDARSLVWTTLAKLGKDLTPDTFISTINQELGNRLATKEVDYYLLTSISLDPAGIPTRTMILDNELRMCPKGYPRLFDSHKALVAEHKIPLIDTPNSYCKVVIRTRAKSTGAAIHRATRALDVQRALWCLMGNRKLQITFGTLLSKPINAVRLGSRHTLHKADGTAARDGIWFEPNFVEATPCRFRDPKVVTQNSRWALRQIAASAYGDRLINSLLLFVRALDLTDDNSAFIRLWGALESLTIPGQSDYEKLVRRAVFLFKDQDYYRQLLEHLREYRNANVHAGEESESARTNCFQLQMVFANLAWFHIRNAKYFGSLTEATTFLDYPRVPAELKRALQLSRKALRYRSV